MTSGQWQEVEWEERSDRFVGGVAECDQGALGAEGVARDADFSAEPDDLMANETQRSCGTSFIRSCSTFSGVFCLVSFRRWVMRKTCVSTTTPLAMPKAVPSTTLAVFRATPGSGRSCSMVRGTSPPKSWTIFVAAPMMLFALLRKKPVERISFSNSACARPTKSCGRGVFAKKLGGDLVHALVGALGGEDGGDQKLESVLVLQRAFGVRKELVERGEDFLQARGRGVGLWILPPRFYVCGRSSILLGFCWHGDSGRRINLRFKIQNSRFKTKTKTKSRNQSKQANLQTMSYSRIQNSKFKIQHEGESSIKKSEVH